MRTQREHFDKIESDEWKLAGVTQLPCRELWRVVAIHRVARRVLTETREPTNAMLARNSRAWTLAASQDLISEVVLCRLKQAGDGDG